MNTRALTFQKVAISLAATVALLLASYLLFSALFAHADTGPTITTVIQNGNNSPITQATLGTGVHDKVTVASSTSQVAPTGSVNFNLYANTSCSGTSTLQSNVALVSGVAQSSTTTVPNTGLSYLVSYNGDISNVAATGTCEALVATASSTSIATSLSASSIFSGSSVFDSATLSNMTSNAGGTVAYAIYQDNACTQLSQAAGTVAVTNGVVPNSNTIPFTTGTYWWQAVYSGDANNTPATSTCGSEMLTVNPQPIVKSSPTLSTTLSTTSAAAGSSVQDSATLTNASTSASGTVAYTVYTNNSCTTGAQGAGTVPVTNGVVPSSNSIVFNTPGTYWWQAVYSGDTKDNPATSTCGGEVLTINGVATQPQPGHIVVDEVTNPSGTSTIFSFNTSGSGYSAFSLTDGAAPNNQTLSPGAYSVSQSVPAGWSLTSAVCATNGGTGGPYTPGSTITLNSGDTVSCVFVDTAIASSTNGNGGHHHGGDGDNDQNGNNGNDGNDNDHGGSVASSTGNGDNDDGDTATSTDNGDNDTSNGGFFCNGFPFCNGNPFSGGFPFGHHAAIIHSINHWGDNNNGDNGKDGNDNSDN